MVGCPYNLRWYEKIAGALGNGTCVITSVMLSSQVPVIAALYSNTFKQCLLESHGQLVKTSFLIWQVVGQRKWSKILTSPSKMEMLLFHCHTRTRSKALKLTKFYVLMWSISPTSLDAKVETESPCQCPRKGCERTAVVVEAPCPCRSARVSPMLLEPQREQRFTSMKKTLPLLRK